MKKFPVLCLLLLLTGAAQASQTGFPDGDKTGSPGGSAEGANDSKHTNSADWGAIQFGRKIDRAMKGSQTPVQNGEQSQSSSQSR